MTPLPSLPVDTARAEIVTAAREHRRFVLVAPPGTGKSTRVPGMLRDDVVPTDSRVIVLQPRRLPARMLAQRVALERGGSVGGEVGYQMRFERRASAATQILYVTEGLLLRWIEQNPELPGVGAVLFDEFHERHLEGDLALGWLRSVQTRQRPDLILGVMSATLEIATVAQALGNPPTIEVEAPRFPLAVSHRRGHATLERRELPQAAAQAFRDYARAGERGDVLIFMPGAAEIFRTLRALDALPEARNWVAFPLHGSLPPSEQDAALAPHPQPKIIVSTNVAETSLTIPGVRHVIDSGLARIPHFDPARGINTLTVQPISQASATQRAGRAAREAAGSAHRLWTSSEHARRPEQTAPEIARLELADIVLRLMAHGWPEAAAFPWIDPPRPAALTEAKQLLLRLGAINDADEVTPIGRRMARLPLDPRWSRLLLAAQERGCLLAMARIVALSEGGSILVRPRDKAARERQTEALLHAPTDELSDWFLELRAWDYAEANRLPAEVELHRQNFRAARQSFQQLLRQMGDVTNADDAWPSHDDLVACLLVAFPDFLCRRLSGNHRRSESIGGQRGELDRASVIPASDLFLPTDALERNRRDGVELEFSSATVVTSAQLAAFTPELLAKHEKLAWDPRTSSAVRQNGTYFAGWPLAVKESPAPPSEAATELLVQALQTGELKLKNWDDTVEDWINRANLLAEVAPELGFAKITDEDRPLLLSEICHGAVKFSEVSRRPVLPVVQSWLDPALRPLIDQWLPARWELPNGRRARIHYQPDRPPVLSAPIAHLLGVPMRALTLAEGRVRPLIELLAPNQRPVQRTADLDTFWTSGYVGIRKELRGRYPKHPWPEPEEAAALLSPTRDKKRV